MDDAGVDWSDPDSVELESTGLAGWYWWTCSPGCMPEGDPMGPFSTAERAMDDAFNAVA